jgi:subtilisin family serine protease
MRPDILAPGQFIISSRSSDAVIGDSEFNQQSLVDAEHAVLEGTSMSTPFVTGATATLFAHDGTLTQEDARALLQAGAQPTAPDPNGAFFGEGAGILNVQRSLQALAARAAPTTATHLALHVGDSFLPTEGGLAVGFVATATDDAGTPADLAGTPSLTPTGATVSTALTHPAPGLYRFALAASADGSPRTASVTLASGDGTVSASTSLPVGADRWDALYGLTMGGGCDLSRRDRGLNSTAFAIAALALAGARRRRDLRRARAHCE